MIFPGLIRTISFVADAVFPRRCVSCEREGEVLCFDCASSWAPSVPKTELVAGAVDGRLASFAYADPVARGLLCAWKYEGDAACWGALSKMLKKRLLLARVFVSTRQIDAIVPIPLHPWKEKWRGFDQARLIADEVSAAAGVSCVPLLRRDIFSLKAQADRTPEQRVDAMRRNPFSLQPAFAPPRRVLLIDDVWTTGATAQAAARVLKSEGVEKVFVYTLAQGGLDK